MAYCLSGNFLLSVQVVERSPGRTQIEPEEARGRGRPDICLVERTGAMRRIKQTTECKTKSVTLHRYIA